MRKITIDDVKHAIAYVSQNANIFRDVDDEKVLKLDFSKDLGMGNIRLANVFIELQRVYNLDLPMDVFKAMPDNTIGSFVDSVNKYANKTD